MGQPKTGQIHTVFFIANHIDVVIISSTSFKTIVLRWIAVLAISTSWFQVSGFSSQHVMRRFEF